MDNEKLDYQDLVGQVVRVLVNGRLYDNMGMNSQSNQSIQLDAKLENETCNTLKLEEITCSNRGFLDKELSGKATINKEYVIGVFGGITDKEE